MKESAFYLFPCGWRGPRASSGFALPAAIFLLVVLSALGGYIVHVSTHQQRGHSADIRGTRAYQAARAGIEWGVFNLLRNNACGAGDSFNPGGGLGEFTVTVSCAPAGVATTNNDGGTDVIARRIVATACSAPAAGACPNPAPGENYIERQIAIVVSR